MKIVDSIEVENKNGINFSWSDVMDGQAREFIANEDYSCSSLQFQTRCHSAAAFRDKRAITKKTCNGMIAQFLPKKIINDSLDKILSMLSDWTSTEKLGAKVRWMKARDRRELVNAAVTDGLIECRQIDSGTRPKTEFRRAGQETL